MKRIYSGFEKAVEAVKRERKVNRVMRCIDTAIDNAKDSMDELENQKAEVVESLPETTDINEWVQKLSDVIGAQEEQDAVLQRLYAIKAYLIGDMEATDELKP